MMVNVKAIMLQAIHSENKTGTNNQWTSVDRKQNKRKAKEK